MNWPFNDHGWSTKVDGCKSESKEYVKTIICQKFDSLSHGNVFEECMRKRFELCTTRGGGSRGVKFEEGKLTISLLCSRIFTLIWVGKKALHIIVCVDSRFWYFQQSNFVYISLSQKYEFIYIFNRSTNATSKMGNWDVDHTSTCMFDNKANISFICWPFYSTYIEVSLANNILTICILIFLE